jgi:hypothetical protein
MVLGFFARHLEQAPGMWRSPRVALQRDVGLHHNQSVVVQSLLSAIELLVTAPVGRGVDGVDAMA